MGEISQREAYGRSLVEYGERNQKVIVLDVDTSASTFTNFFATRFPDRFINVGIAEPCMVDVGVGLALSGFIPFINGFAALLSLRAFEQIRTCICYARTNVKIAASYAGVSDFKDGPTHHAIKDIGIMRMLPEMTVIVPADANEIKQWVPIIAEYDGPVYFRLNRSDSIPVHEAGVKVQIGKGMLIKGGKDVTIIATGAMVGRCLQALEIISKSGISARLIEIATIKPIDRQIIRQAAEETGAIVTAEEHTIVGGLGSAVAEVLVEDYPVPLVRIGINDTFTRTSLNCDSLLDAYGMGNNDILEAVQHAVRKKDKSCS